MRGLQVARNTLDREAELVFDARGLLHSEARLKADIRVSTLPEGKDPDEVVREDPAVWEQIIRDAQPIVAHVMKTLAAGQDINDPKVKTEIAQQVLPLIQDLPNAIERDTYLQQLARLLKIDERSLLNQRRISGGKPPIRRKPQFEVPESKLSQASSRAAATTSVKAQMVHNLEEHFLSILKREPELIYKIDRALKQADLPSLSTEDFQNTIHQELLEATMQSLDQDQINPVSFALDHIPFQLLEKAEAILEKSEKINPKQEHILEDMLRTILRMREVQLKESNIQIRFLLEDAQENNKTEITQYNYTIQQNSQKLLRIHKALASADTHTPHH